MLIMMLSWTLSVLFTLMKHPLTLGIILLLQTITMSLITGKIYVNFWFSYLLFLIMVGGMLVMFIYMTSIAANEKFKLPKNYIIAAIMFIAITTSISTNLPEAVTNNFIQSSEMTQHWTMSKFFSSEKKLLMMALMSYMFFTLIVIVNMTEKTSGPLRQK